jgi:uncharacterized damage-inducible protein DinB
MNISAEFLEKSRYFLCREYPTKIELAISSLPVASVWARSDSGSNSIGNLLLHLEGNVRQWIVSHVGGSPDHRHRAAEFAATEGDGAKELFAKLRATLDEVDAVLARLSEADLATHRTIQGRDVTVFEAIYHVVEHFSGHTGQIIMLAKMHAPGSVKFYEDAGGLARPLYKA